MWRKLLNFDRGERPFVGTPFDEIDGVHTKVYIYASQFVHGKSVLDCGCGGGYGSDYLARHDANIVIGTDLSSQTIDQAKALYKKDNLQFIAMDVTDLKFEDCTFDVVVSFQLIEHMRDYKKHLLEARRVLKPGGTFLLTTPNKNITSPNREKPIMPFHVKEFYPHELESLVRDFFGEVRLMGQKTINPLYLVDENKFLKSQRMKVVRLLSSSSIIQMVARLLPLGIKNFFTRPPKICLRPEDLEISEQYREDGYILVAMCKK